MALTLPLKMPRRPCLVVGLCAPREQREIASLLSASAAFCAFSRREAVSKGGFKKRLKTAKNKKKICASAHAQQLHFNSIMFLSTDNGSRPSCRNNHVSHVPTLQRSTSAEPSGRARKKKLSFKGTKQQMSQLTRAAKNFSSNLSSLAQSLSSLPQNSQDSCIQNEQRSR